MACSCHRCTKALLSAGAHAQIASSQQKGAGANLEINQRTEIAGANLGTVVACFNLALHADMMQAYSRSWMSLAKS